jgi:CMP-N,N'-diacetyllegionaminic acid synthase
MSHGARCLAVIPARGGSKAIPGKNIRLLGGRPLIAYTIEAARKASSVNRVVVSTDDEAIAAVAHEAGAAVPFRRPAELAGDDVPTWPVVAHAIAHYETHEGWRPDVVVTLWPTTPFRSTEDIEAGLALLDAETDTVVAMTGIEERHPFWMKRLDDGWVRPFVPEAARLVQRQQLPPLYMMNGGFTIRRRHVFDWLAAGEAEYVRERTRGHVMDAARSIDINTELDFVLAETLLDRAPASFQCSPGGR